MSASSQERLETSKFKRAKILSQPERNSNFNISLLYRPALNQSSPHKKNDLKGLKDRFLQDLHPHIRESIQSKRINFRLKKNFSLDDNKILEDFYSKHPNKGSEFNCNGFMTNIEANEFINPEFEKTLESRKIEKQSVDQNSYLKIIEKNEISKALVYVDKFPALGLRKKIQIIWQRIRRICLKVAKHPKFEFLSLIVIIMNSAFILLDDPATVSSNSLADQTENLFLIIYSIELVIKLLGFGLYEKKTAFFKDFWNILDSIIVGSSLLNIILSDISINLSALRSLRVLRPLKTISTIKKLKNLILTIFSSIPFLIDILMVLFFAYSVFAIAGLHLFQGVLKRRCWSDVSLQLYIPEQICSDDSICPDGFSCVNKFKNPNFGLTNFDNIGYSLLMVFQISTLEGWYFIMDTLRGAFSEIINGLTIIYFVLLIFIGNFLILNLVLAVIIVKFNETQAMKNEKIINIVHSKFCQCNTGLNFSYMKRKGYFIEMSNLSLFANKNSTKKFRYIEKAKYKDLKRQLIFDKTFEFIVSDLRSSRQINIQLSRSGLKNKASKLENSKKDSLKNSWSRVFQKSQAVQSKLNNSKITPGQLADQHHFFKSKVEKLMFQSRVIKNIRNSIRNPGLNNLEISVNSPYKPLLSNFKARPSGQIEPNNSIINTNENESLLPRAKQTKSKKLITSELNFDNNSPKNNFQDSKRSNFAPRNELLHQNVSPEVQKSNSFSDFKELDAQEINSEISDAEIIPDEKFKKEIMFRDTGKKNINIEKAVSGQKMSLSVHKRKKSFYRGVTQNFNRGSNIVARQSLKSMNLFGKSSKTSRLKNAITANNNLKRTGSSLEVDILLRKNTNHLQINLNLCQNFSHLEYLQQKTEVLPSYIASNHMDEKTMAKMRENRARLKIFYDLKSIMHFNSKTKTVQNNKTRLQSKETNFSTTSAKTFDRSDKKFTNATTKRVKSNNVIRSFNTFVTFESHKTNQSYIASPFYMDLKQSASPYFYTNFNQEFIGKSMNSLKAKKGQNNQLLKASDKDPLILSKDCKHKTKNFYQITKFFTQEFKAESKTPEEIQEAEYQLRYLSLFYHTIVERDISCGSISVHNNSIGDVVSDKRFPIEKISNIFSTLNSDVPYIWLRGFGGKLTMLRWHIRNFFESKAVENFFLLLVLLNTILLCTPGLLSKTGDEIVSLLMSIITYIFIAEAVIKITGYGFKKYIDDLFNVFDFLIILLSIAEMFIESNGSVLSAIKVVRVLRTFRVLRVTRLLRSLKFMRIIIEVVLASLEQFIYIALLLVLFIVIFSMMGMQLFAGKFNFQEGNEIKRQNFDSFLDAFITLFQIITMENWNDLLVLTYRSDQNFIFSLLYLIMWIFIGNYILLNLFMAILLDGFSSYSVLHKFKDVEDEFVLIDKLIASAREKELREKQDLEKKLIQKRPLKLKPESQMLKSNEVSILKSSMNLEEEIVPGGNLEEMGEGKPSGNNLHHIHQENESVSSSEDDFNTFLNKEKGHEKLLRMKTEQICCEYSLFFIKKSHWLRVKVIRIVSSPKFENFILLMILLSSIKLIIDTYQNENWTGTPFLKFLNICDTLFNSLFLLEFLCKIIAYGFIFCKGSYLRDSWNIIDFLIVCTSMIDMMLEQLDLPFLKILRILRTLRPLRFLSTNQNMRIVVSSLVESIGGIMNVLLVIFIVWIMFGILGMNLLADKLGFCNFPDSRSYYKVGKEICMASGGVWDNWGWNFDNIFNSLVTLFILTSGESWPNIMFSAMDSDSADIGPSHFGNYYIFPYFIVFMLLGSLFLMNLFVGVIFMQFTTEQDNEKKKHFRMITDEQFKWIIMQKMIEGAEPNYNIIVSPKNKFRLFFYKIVNSPYFESFVLFLIVLNIITMAIVYDDMSESYSNIIEKINLTFTIVFIAEAILKLVAQGFKQYFSSGWNKFDFVIVLSSILDIVLTNFLDIQSIRVYPQLARIIKILRVTRLFKLMKSQRMQSLNKIIRTLIFAIPALLNVLLLLCLIYFLFSILGVFAFQTKNGDFDDFGTALIFLFRLSTGEDWPTKMFENSKTSPILSRMFFLAYIFLSTFVMINMFVLIVIEQFENFYFNPNNPINSFDDIADEFRKTWILFSYKYQGKKIRSNDIYNFFACLPIPLGFHVPLKNESDDVYGEHFNLSYFLSNLRFDPNFIRRKIADMNIYEDNLGFVSFGQVLHVAMKNAFGYKCLSNASKDTRKKIRKIELQTIAKIFKESEIMAPSKTPASRSRQKRIVKTANPFCNILFAQLTFKIWQAYAKKHSNIVVVSSENLDEVLFQNPDYHFNQKVLSQIRKPSHLNIDVVEKKRTEDIE